MFNIIKKRDLNEEPIISLSHEMEHKKHLKKHKSHIDRAMYKSGITIKRNCIKTKIIGKGKMLTYIYWAEPKDTTLKEKVVVAFRPDNNYPRCKLRLILEAGSYLNIDLTSDKDHTNWSLSRILEEELKDLEHNLKRELEKLKKAELQRLKAA
ncbi:MAG: hypothetical protein ACMXYG_00195 [Candidatus Woesearchaeota archaeon]